MITAQSNDEPVVQAVLFYSPTCYHCHYVITEVIVPMVDEYGEQLQIIGIDTTQAGGQQLYQAVIERCQIPQARQGVPTLVIGETVLVGSGEIPEQFPMLVETTLATGGIAWPDIPNLVQLIETQANPSPTPTPAPVAAANPTSDQDQTDPVYVAYFFDPTCIQCAQVSASLEQFEAQYPNLVVQDFNVNDHAALNKAICQKYGVPDAYRLMTPMIFIGQECLTPDEITPTRLQALIENPETAKMSPPWEGLEGDQLAASQRIVERFKQFSLLAVVGAGLLDGVNPCAFTTIIFFVSYLALVGRKGREILLVGGAFTLAVFLTYLAMGFGLAEIVRRMGSFTLMGQIIYGVTAVVCLLLAVMSILDYIKIRRGQLQEIALQLPNVLKQRIHQTIRTRSRMQGFVGAAFGAGVLVSIFELACTGQVYLPTIVFVTGVAELRLTAILYLVLYNLMFVVPLVAVFLVTYLGTSRRRLITGFQANAGLVKILTAVLVGVLGVWLGYMVLMM